MAMLNDFRQEFLDTSEFITAYTSGSTGEPKAIRLAKADMQRSAQASNQFFGITSDDVIACPLSADYIAGKMMVVRAIEAGCRLIELPLSNEIHLPDLDKPIALLPIVPSQLNSLLENSDLEKKVSTILIGGAAPSYEECLKIPQSVRAYISYGMTETCSHVAIADARDPQRIFHAMPDITFSVDNSGKLIINAPKFKFGKLIVNDLVELLSTTSFRLLGRADEVINSGGLKLHPNELELMYNKALSPLNYYVVGEHSEKWGQSVLLVIEGRSENVIDRLKNTGIDHKFLPKRIVAVNELPRTSNGKIIRKIPQ